MPATLVLFGHLLRNQWRLRLRSFAWRQHWLIVVLATLLGLYIATVLIVSGIFWKELAWSFRRERDAVAFLNANLLTIFLGLFTARFFLQRTPRLRIQPLLRLPPTHTQLVHFFQLSSLLSVHNLIPLLLLVPLWIRHILNGPYEGAGVWGWMVSVLLIILLSHYFNNLLRAALRRSREGFALVLGVLVLLVSLDFLLDAHVLSGLSAYVFSTLVIAEPIIPLSLVGLLAVIYASSSLLLRSNLLIEEDDPASGRVVLWQAPFLTPRHSVLNLMLLELKLMWRSERPKLYFFFSVIFATIYVAAPLLDGDLATSVFVQALVGMFASGIFALNYGQFMFSWESSYFDGLLVRDVPLHRMLLAKLLLLQLSCVAFFVLSLPIFLALAPHLVPLHVAFTFYNAGISTILTLTLALGNRKHIRLANVGFFNYEGFSLVHWLWFIPTVVPPALLLYELRARPELALLLIGGVGMTSLLFNGVWVSFFERRLAGSIHAMAAGFRAHES